MRESFRNSFIFQTRWAFAAVIIGFIVGFGSAVLCVVFHLVIFGFNIMYIISPILAGVAETVIARRKYGRTTGAISALLTFIIINIYGWLLPGWIYDKDPVTLSFITIVAIILMFQAAFPTLMNYILFVFGLGTFRRILEFLLVVPSKFRRKPTVEEIAEEIEVTGATIDETLLDELIAPLSSVPDSEERMIKEYKGLVVGEAVAKQKEVEGGRAAKALRILEPVKLEDMNIDEARRLALSRMLKEAESLGANRVIEVIFNYVSMAGLQGSVLVISATGTAVITE